MSEALKLEAAVGWCALGVHSVCTRCVLVLKGWWSQVVSGVVTLGCLSPRPRLCAPVGACRRALVRASSFARACASSTRPRFFLRARPRFF